MYSLVLMTAMTASPDIPEADGFFRNLFSGGNGCSGASCNGNCYGNYAPKYSCFGGGCSGSSASPGGCSGRSASPAGCSGSTSASNNCNGCNGCNGTGWTFGSRVRKLFERNDSNGCNGSCHGCNGGAGSGYGCSGSGYGCSGSVGYSCFGSSAYSCFGGPAVSYTPMFNGGLSCQGGIALPAPPPVFDTYPGMPPAPTNIPPGSIPYAPPESAPGMGPNVGLRPAGGVGSALTSSGNNSRATVIVRLPVDARLFAESKALSLTGAERRFVSPELPAGQEFMYRFRVEYERDGETVSVTKKVAIRAGAVLSVEFTDLTAAKAAPETKAPERPTTTALAATPTSNPVGGNAPVTLPVVTPNPLPPVTPPTATPTGPATERATITVKIPAGATLFVDDRKSPSNEPVRKFSTPPVPVGKDFAYLMRAEVVRNGQTETFTQKVPFRAGEQIEVDFTGVGR